MTRDQILARVKATSSDSDEVQEVGYSDEEIKRGEKAVSLLTKLQQMRALWKRDPA